MGCCGGRGPLNPIETAIVKGEDELGFSKCSTKNLFLHFTRFSDGTRMGIEDFVKAAKAANLNID